MTRRVNCVRPLLAATMTLSLAVAARAEGDATLGAERFKECAACHSTEKGVNNLGPSLNGVFQRKAGEIAEFRYSPAMKKSGIAWSAATLDAFITDPQAVVPANRMPYAGLTDAAGRADLIAYLLKAAQ